jgi:hypothetical protein
MGNHHHSHFGTSPQKETLGQIWWFTSVVPALGRLRQEQAWIHSSVKVYIMLDHEWPYVYIFAFQLLVI